MRTVIGEGGIERSNTSGEKSFGKWFAYKLPTGEVTIEVHYQGRVESNRAGQAHSMADFRRIAKNLFERILRSAGHGS